VPLLAITRHCLVLVVVSHEKFEVRVCVLCSKSQNQLNSLCSVVLLLTCLRPAVSGWESARRRGGEAEWPGPPLALARGGGKGGPARLRLWPEEGGGPKLAWPASGSSQRGGGGPARLWLWPEEGGGPKLAWPASGTSQRGEVAQPASGSGQRRGRGLGWPGLPLALACSGLELL